MTIYLIDFITFYFDHHQRGHTNRVVVLSWLLSSYKTEVIEFEGTVNGLSKIYHRVTVSFVLFFVTLRGPIVTRLTVT